MLDIRRFREGLLALLLLVSLASPAAAQGQVLKIVGDHFEFNGQPRFLVFVSYFDGMRRLRTGTPASNVFNDFDYLSRLGVDGIRVFPMWYDQSGVRSQNTVCDGRGQIRQQRLDELKQLIEYARGYFVVDVSFSAETIPMASGGTAISDLTLTEYGNCVKAITEALVPARHVLFDIQNESELNGPGGPALTHSQVKQLRDIIKGADPERIVVASASGDSLDFPKERARIGELDAIAYHDPRENDWYAASRLQPILTSLRAPGKPVYLQEPEKYQNRRTLTAANFREAVENAKRLGAAAWCFHTEAGFWMNGQPFAPEPTESDFLDTFRVPLDQTSWGVTPFSSYYLVRLFVANQRYFVRALNRGGGDVQLGDRDPESSFVLHDLNGGELRSGDRVTLRTANDVNYLQAQNGGGSVLTAAGTQEDAWETFVIEKLTGDAPSPLAYPYRRGSAIKYADWIALRAADTGPYLSPAITNPAVSVRVDAPSVTFNEHIEFLFEPRDPVYSYFTAPPQGVGYLVPVSATANRSWTATSSAAWLTVQGASSGVGPATLSVQVSANPGPSTRTGQIAVADQVVTVSQGGVGCTFDISPASNSLPRAGGTGTVQITASSSGCGRTATTADAWITITSGATGSGSGTLAYSVGANNTTSARTGTILVANRSFTITQQGNAAPVVAITAPASGSIVPRSTPVTVSATATDPDGTVVRVDFYADGVKIGTDASSPYSIAWANPPAGWHTLTAEAFDDLGGAGSAPAIALGVNNLDSVTVTPSSVRTGQAANIVVTGVNPCGAVDLDFGDGSHTTFAIYSLPMTQPHAWTTGGTKTVTATAHGNCAGVLATTVTVIANVPPAVSLTSPANGSGYVAPASVPLQATASDPETSVVRVDFYAGSTLIASDSTSPYSYTWSGVPSGTYSITARAVDTEGGVGISAAALVTVRDVGAVSASPSPVVVGQASTVSVTGSTTCGAVQIDYGDGTVITYPLSGLPTSQSHVWTTAGVKTIAATGQGNCAGQVSTALTVNANPAPTVSLTAPANGSAYTSGTGITLTATAADSDGVARVDFYAGSTLLGSDTTAPYAIGWAVASGATSLTARAYDVYGASAISAAATVTGRDVVAVSISPGALTSGQTATVTVTGSASCGAVQINYGDGVVITYPLSGLPTSQAHVYGSGGTKVVTATGQGNCAGQASATIYVNYAPSVALTSPANGNTYVGPATIPLAANASDPDGAIAAVYFYANGALIASDTTAPYAYNWPNVGVGTYGISAVTVDNAGAAVGSAVSTITVSDPGPSRVTSVVAPATVGVGQTAVITVYGTNPCGLVYISWGDGVGWHHPVTQLPYSYGYAWSVPGTYTITAIGGGNCAGQATTTITVTGVEPAPSPLEPPALEEAGRGERDRREP